MTERQVKGGSDSDSDFLISDERLCDMPSLAIVCGVAYIHNDDKCR